MSKFNITYSINGSGKVYFCAADPADVQKDMSDTDLAMLYSELVDQDFSQKFLACGQNEEAFIEWAKQVIASRDK